jgi:hypothetical protein
LIAPVNEYFMAQAIIQTRAVNCISQWWKAFNLSRRIEALSTIRRYVGNIDQPTLYMEESIYTHMGVILTAQSKSLRFVEQNLKFDFKHPMDSETNYLRFSTGNMFHSQKSNQGATYTSEELTVRDPPSDGSNSWHLVYSNTTAETHRFMHYPLPKWVLSVVPDFDRYKLSDNQISIFFNNFMGIIHKASFDSMPAIRDFNELVDPSKKTMNLNLGLNFISVHCMSVAEAQKRALLVAILSYNLKRRSFIKMFT